MPFNYERRSLVFANTLMYLYGGKSYYQYYLSRCRMMPWVFCNGQLSFLLTSVCACLEMVAVVSRKAFWPCLSRDVHLLPQQPAIR